ncbi:MAG: bacteriohemerythrin [Pseudomonadales bacterium]|nr:bacteriohemerythrin [Pseudomonadales bacterium]
MKIEWSSQYELGIGVIDRQHRRIVDYINQLDELQGSETSETLTRILDDLVDYTFSHFAFEEALLEEVNYADLNGHSLEHDTFSRQIKTMQERCESGESMADELADMLLHWLLKHIQSEDRAYAPIVREKIAALDPVKYEGWMHKTLRRFFRI